jgi:tellurite resistance protein
MELHELSHEEEVVLRGPLRAGAPADGRYTAAEKSLIDVVRAQLGSERFDAAIGAARTRFTTREALKAAAREITRQEARALIYAELTALAAADGTSAEEEKPLAWLASWWNLPHA